MDLPKHYLPIRSGSHVKNGKCKRLLFADYGSYENVNISVDMDDTKEKLSSWSQKGQGAINGLSNALPSLPLFDSPLQVEWHEKDSVLGVKNFKDTMDHLKSFFTILRFKKVKKSQNDKYTKKLKEGKKEYLETGQLGQHLKDDTTFQKFLANYTDISTAYNCNCLNGFNRDFYGGLISVSSKCGEDKHYLAHAGGPALRDVFISAVTQEPASCLKRHQALCHHSVNDRVLQIDTPSFCREKLLLCARQKHDCQLFRADFESQGLVLQRKLSLSEGSWTSQCFSNLLENEMLLSTSSGAVYLWDIESNSNKIIVEKPPRFSCPDSWSCAYLAGHPREIVVADNTSVEIFDHRSHWKDSRELFILDSNLLTLDERVMAAGLLDFPYHAVVTDYNLFIMDQRFSSSPVYKRPGSWHKTVRLIEQHCKPHPIKNLSHDDDESTCILNTAKFLVLFDKMASAFKKWPKVIHWRTEFKASPQYLKIINNELSPGKLLFLASQQPAEVVCFPVDICGGEVPRSSILPWKMSSMRYRDYVCDVEMLSRKFQTSLAGLTVMSRSDGLTVFQMDSYGDVFYQSLKLQSVSQSKWSTASCTESDLQSARCRINQWMASLDSIYQSALYKDVPVVQVEKVVIDTVILKKIFQAPATPVQTTKVDWSLHANKKLHKNLKSLQNLNCKGPNTQLLLALKEGKDITECLKRREEDHDAKKKRLRKKNFFPEKINKRSKIRVSFNQGSSVAGSDTSEKYNMSSLLSPDLSDEDLVTPSPEASSLDFDSSQSSFMSSGKKIFNSVLESSTPKATTKGHVTMANISPHSSRPLKRRGKKKPTPPSRKMKLENRQTDHQTSNNGAALDDDMNLLINNLLMDTSTETCHEQEMSVPLLANWNEDIFFSQDNLFSQYSQCMEEVERNNRPPTHNSSQDIDTVSATQSPIFSPRISHKSRSKSGSFCASQSLFSDDNDDSDSKRSNSQPLFSEFGISHISNKQHTLSSGASNIQHSLSSGETLTAVRHSDVSKIKQCADWTLHNVSQMDTVLTSAPQVDSQHVCESQEDQMNSDSEHTLCGAEPLDQFHDVVRWLQTTPTYQSQHPTGHTLTSWPCSSDSSSDSDSCSDRDEFVQSSLPDSLTRLTLSSPSMKYMVDPDLAGFLCSPKNVKRKLLQKSKKNVKVL